MQVSYEEGDVFAIPLPSGGYARVVIARADGKGIVLGYFYGPRIADTEHLSGSELRPEDAIRVGFVGDLGITSTWRSVGKLNGFSRARYPVPVFHREVLLTPTVLKVYYDEDTLNVVREERLAPGEQRGPKDGLMGAEFAERLLDRLL